MLLPLVILVFPTATSAQTTTVATANSTVYGGYSGFVSMGSITNISARWNVPPVTCQLSLSARQAFFQIIEVVSPTGKAYFAITTGELCKRFSAFTFVLSPEFAYGGIDGSTGVLQTSLLVNQGDNISGSISINATSNKIVWMVKDTTRGESASFTAIVPGASIVNNAVWMLQGPNSCSPRGCRVDLAQFSAPLKFSDCTFAASGKTLPLSHLPSLTKVMLVDGKARAMAKTSGISSGTGFNLTFVRST